MIYYDAHLRLEAYETGQSFYFYSYVIHNRKHYNFKIMANKSLLTRKIAHKEASHNLENLPNSIGNSCVICNFNILYANSLFN